MVKSAERVADALKFLASRPEGATYSDVQQGMGLPKSSLHALLQTLVETRLATFDDSAKRYTLGPLVWELTVAFSNNVQLVPLALPHMEQIADQFSETTQLAVLDGPEVVYVAKVPSRHPIQLVSNVGTRLPAYATGIGKALLACLSRRQLDQLFPNEVLETYTNQTIATKGALLDELEAVRKRGYALDRGEYSSGIFCVSVPIVAAGSHANAAMSLSIPKDRYPYDLEAAIAHALRQEAYAIAQKLGTLDPEHWRMLDAQES